MTAMNAFVRANGAYLIADAASYADDGRVMRLGEKVVSSARLRLVIGRCGRLEEGCQREISTWLRSQPSQVSALQNVARLLRELVEHDAEAQTNGASAIVGPIPEGIRLTLAWWDLESNRPDAAIIANVPQLMGGAEPYTLRRVGTLFMPALQPKPWPDHTFDPETDGVKLARIQRNTPDERGIYQVGGRFLRYRVHVGGIDQTTICTWSDRLGRKINPRPTLTERARSHIGTMVESLSAPRKRQPPQSHVLPQL
jgi:hypothetical protein